MSFIFLLKTKENETGHNNIHLIRTNINKNMQNVVGQTNQNTRKSKHGSLDLHFTNEKGYTLSLCPISCIKLAAC
jgi:hypothetical protein